MRGRDLSCVIAFALVTPSIVVAACGDESFTSETNGDGDGGADAPATLDGAAETDATQDGATDAALEAGTSCAFGNGTQMVLVEGREGASPFCVEVHEVTEQQFAAFTTASGIMPWIANDAGLCTGNPASADYNPAPLEPAASRGTDYPVGVRWCAARAYCAWLGRRLCASTVTNGQEVGEFYRACSGNSVKAYGYGNTADASACSPDGGLYPVGSVASCTGGVSGVVDINGNRVEWVEGWGIADGGAPNIYRAARGLGQNASCSTVHGVVYDDNSLGFRCCADPQ